MKAAILTGGMCTCLREETEFRPKPMSEKYVNGGFFIFEPEIFKYLTDESTLEKETLEGLVPAGQLKSFAHNGFWQPMGT